MAAESDLQTTFWRDDVWLENTPLTKETALRDYFALSTFYDPQCNNETIKTLSLPLTELQYGLADTIECGGVEYMLVTATEPDLFVIKKQYRSETQATTAMAYYYILSGTVFQAPDLYSAIQSKVKRCQHLLDKSFRSFAKTFDPCTATVEESETTKRKFQSQEGWEKMKTGTDIVNAVLSNYPLLPIPPVNPSVAASHQGAEKEKHQDKKFKADVTS